MAWLAALVLELAAAAASAAPARLAVLELRDEAGKGEAAVAYLTDRVRDAGSRALPGDGFLVMTRESIRSLLPPGVKLADCLSATCEVEVGRTIGADYVVTGEVLSFAGQLRLNLKAFHCGSGAFLGGEVVGGAGLADLETGASAAGERLFALVRRHAGRGDAPEPAAAAAPGTDSRGTAPAWSPRIARQAVVSFDSDPPGAVVMADGALLCASTPCRRELPVGMTRIVMHRERYESREEMVAIPDEAVARVDWKLAPTFGWLTVTSDPESLAVEIDGRRHGVTPLARQELTPGGHLVRCSDPRYADAGERVLVARAEERTVRLTPAPRDGAIEVTARDAKGDAVAGTLFADGHELGPVPGSYRLLVGRHSLRVTGEGRSWTGAVEIAERQVTPVRALLARPSGSSGAIVVRGELMWTQAGADLAPDWHSAARRAEACRAGGHRDWRLPTIGELRTLYDAARSVPCEAAGGVAHIASPFELGTPRVWSGSLTMDYASTFVFDLSRGDWTLVPIEQALPGTDALFVRSVGE